ncbi:MAG: hypothetical protein H6P99_955 [Holophagaceae bacterium]|nr:hypothetical protein [Holophagaceae bacterium]
MKMRSIVFGWWLSLQLFAGPDWAPIPPEVWAIKSGPKGAVVLEERVRFQVREMVTVYRARIFSEEGRGAANLPDLPKLAYGIKGRTVYPDGREVTFDNRKDFAERKVETGRSESTRVHMVAPGVTADCVVEVRWRERCDGYGGGLPRRFVDGLYGQWVLGNPYPTLLSVLEIAENMPLASSITSGNRWKPEVGKADGFRTFTYRNLAAVEAPPYSLTSANGFPRLELFWQPDSLIQAFPEGRDAYWSEAFKRIYLPEYEDDIDKGRPFKAFAAELTRDLPATFHARAVELLNRLQVRVKNVSIPTAEETASLPKDFWDSYASKRLDKAAASGLASSRGMRLLFYHLLKVAGIQPSIGKVVDRDKDLFSYGRLNAWQFHHDLIGVEEVGKGTLWLDAGNRFATAGVVHPDYQGTSMLVFSTLDAKVWKPSRELMPASPAAANQRVYTYELTLDEDSDRFAVKAEFGGYPEYAERFGFLSLEAKDQSRVLKERFESNRKTLSVASVKVSNATDPARRVFWEVTGALERESGRYREVEPFPGMPWPLWVPDKLDATRSESIVLPYLQIHTANSTFEVPKGFRFTPPPALRYENEFGMVSWTSEWDPQTRKVTIQLRTQVVSLSLGPDHWKAFREYLGWIQEGCRRTVILSKEA